MSTVRWCFWKFTRTDKMAGQSDQKQFESLLQTLMNPDNETRTKTEEVYEKLPIAQKVTFLVTSLRSADNAIEIRTLAAVLLRRLFTNDFSEWWPKLPPEIQEGLKKELMNAIQEELTPPVKRKICDAAAELSRNLIDDDNAQQWTDFLKFMFDCANNEDPSLKESALHIFSVVPGIFGDQQTHYLDVIRQMLHQSLAFQDSPAVCFEAVRATTAFLINNEGDSQIVSHFRDLLPGVIHAVSESVNQQEDDGILKCLIELAENVPKFLRPQVENVITFCMKVLSDTNLEDSWRQLGLEAIVSLAETAPGMVRKCAKLLPMLVPQVLAMMVDLEDEEDWAVSDEVENEDDDSNAVAGESALDRLCCALTGVTMLQHILANIPQMLQNSDWRYRHAALMAISACGEGCHAQMETMLGNVLDCVLPFLKDPHPRVRYAACNAVGQLSTDFGPNFQKKFHSRIVSELLLVMDDDAHPRVQTHGAAALVNFSEDCPKSILVVYINDIMDKLEKVLSNKMKELMEKGTKMVLEQMVTTLASVADTAEEKFITYYDRFMPCLKYIVQHADNTEYKLLRGKTIECISLIGLAVGRDKFMQDCSDVMQLLLKTQTDMKDLADDDPQISYMIAAWARMCKILGKDFEQYLPLVMGPVLQAASLKPEVTLLDSEDVSEVENDTDWQFVTLGDAQSFGIKTVGLEEKSTACQMLVCYARELKEGFAAYTQEVVNLMVPLLKFYFHDEVRMSAAESLPYLIECAKIRGESYVVEMWNYICPNLLHAIKMEPEISVLPDLMGSLAKCVEILGKGCLTADYMQQTLAILDKYLVQHFERQAERQEKRMDEDYDEVTEEQLLQEDDEDVYILSKVSDLVHALYGTHKEEFNIHFETLLPHFVKLISPERPWPDRQWGLCIFDDVLEHAGPSSIKYEEFFLETLLQSVCDKQPEVRQAALFGVGVMAMYGGEAYAKVIPDVMPRLLQIIQAHDSRSVENANPTENAISAVTKICKYHSNVVNVTELLPLWLSWLPVTEDEDEAAHIYNYLCDQMEGGNQLILGEANCNLPVLIQIFSQALACEVLNADEDVKTRVLQLTRTALDNQEIAQACLSILTDEQKSALQKELSKPLQH
ncbi:importin-5-like isoform X7 [Dreissena polymorpha]|uniref:importin-5-like isoform X2 n=1 Tax=Dreissena polymorpha TaxID=45954 RepID=UPI0022642128|nr:importin-5-like isoform X2 [Dreissena polymorpha]XP_052214367.1 importin-5-like isoform X3 [Dreissena polymorpha]XP_052214368.1 importin-5-like isoform X4 [Dreissena polymorpha]XP_052214369.1 importin-5-like isoform X5 [Dreissena polymorpha]XP_052214370.1 importin-5-like isoform X6 [Dreissena polymorpha]XP_052214371.1 importin-5-like isoform X7 [Dreissena polymorpha]